MSKYDKLDLVSIEILKILSKYSFEEVQLILKKTEAHIGSIFFCTIDEEGFENIYNSIKNEVG